MKNTVMKRALIQALVSLTVGSLKRLIILTRELHTITNLKINI